MTTKLGWDLPVSARPDRLEAFREPVRAAVLLASVLFIVASRLTWIEGMLPYQPHIEVSGYANAGDGAITLVAALFTLGWALRRSFFESRQTAVVVFPLVIGVAGLVITRLAIQNAEILIASWETRGGAGSVSIGIWLTGLAALAMTIVQTVATPGTRATAAAMLTVASALIGTGGGTFFVGLVSEAVSA
ncbi:MAG: hypothetical protein L0221_13940, partial [Chloroflexi bacterium]|nr:hypothetical protein [Chloroflexota bacterium]